MSRDLQHNRDANASTAERDIDVDAEHDPEVSRRASNAGLRREVQKKGDSSAEPQHVHAAAQRGTSSAATALPHADQIQASFGQHDISGIQAHVDGSSARDMGAEAYATGNHVVFNKQPDLHTAAHEAAHVVQQAKGVNLKGGVGEAGDAHERAADEVADRVVAGKPAGDLLGPVTSSAAPAQSAGVQMKPEAKEEQETDEAKKGRTHNEARHDTYGALRASMMLASSEMHAAARAIREARQKDYGEASREPAFDIIKGKFDHVTSVASHTVALAKKLDPMITDAAEKQLLGPEFRAIWGGYKDFKTEMDAANNFANEQKHPLNANPDWIRNGLIDLNDRFGGFYKAAETEATFHDGGSGGDAATLTSTALDEHLDAAKASAAAVRAGTDMDIGRLRAHVGEAQALAKQIPTDKKSHSAHKAKFAALIHEFKELEKEKPVFVPNLKDLQPAMDEFAKLAK